ncbi:hypothetical protein VQ056_02880 [Paenibacillus sp. JTLBN-2024]
MLIPLLIGAIIRTFFPESSTCLNLKARSRAGS